MAEKAFSGDLTPMQEEQVKLGHIQGRDYALAAHQNGQEFNPMQVIAERFVSLATSGDDAEAAPGAEYFVVPFLLSAMAMNKEIVRVRV